MNNDQWESGFERGKRGYPLYDSFLDKDFMSEKSRKSREAGYRDGKVKADSCSAEPYKSSTDGFFEWVNEINQEYPQLARMLSFIFMIIGVITGVYLGFDAEAEGKIIFLDGIIGGFIGALVGMLLIPMAYIFLGIIALAAVGGILKFFFV